MHGFLTLNQVEFKFKERLFNKEGLFLCFNKVNKILENLVFVFIWYLSLRVQHKLFFGVYFIVDKELLF